MSGNGTSSMKDHILISVRLLTALTLLLGVAYPLAVWAIGRVAFRDAANGSFVSANGRVVGSSLIGQRFTRPEHFHGRPSAAGDAGYDATSSGGSNLAPTSKKLADGVTAAVEAVRKEDPGTGPVPADAVTASASGLDPHISPAYALRQVPRVARATGLPEADLRSLVGRRTERKLLGLFGEERVNVLLLNLHVDAVRAARR